MSGQGVATTDSGERCHDPRQSCDACSASAVSTISSLVSHRTLVEVHKIRPLHTRGEHRREIGDQRKGSDAGRASRSFEVVRENRVPVSQSECVVVAADNPIRFDA
jgi:hypothetical protein